MSIARNRQPELAIHTAIEEIAADNTSGAAEILRRTGNVFSLLIARQAELSESGLEQARQAVLETSIALVRAQPDMSLLLRLASAAVSAGRCATTAKEVLDSAENAAVSFNESAALKASAAAFHAASLIRDGLRILTHSRSSTVVEAFIEARRAGRDFSVVATESRPLFEGQTLAGTLAGEGIRVTLIADAAASLAMNRVDFVLVGADKITPENLVNKIGTRMIALAARERGLPVYAVCDTSKFIDADYLGGSGLDTAAGELWPDAPQGVAAVNRQFEPTPLAYFESIVTEDGILSTDETARRAEAASIDKSLLDALDRLR